MLLTLWRVLLFSTTVANANTCIPDSRRSLQGYIKSTTSIGNTSSIGNTTSAGTATPNKDSTTSIDSTKTHWAIVALVYKFENLTSKRNQLIAKLLRRLNSSTRQITILMFSEKSFTPEQIEEWNTDFNGTNSIVKIVDTTKHGFEGTSHPFGYRYMCKFFMLDIYEHLQPYDFYMRCDTDCLLTRVDYDILHWFESRDMQYGWLGSGIESHVPTIETMPPFVINYTANCGIQPSNLLDQSIDTPYHYYNNFHLGKPSFFNRPDVRHFLVTVKDSGYVTSHRWGDATVQGYAVRLFGDPKKCSQVPDMEYVHGSHRIKVVNGTGYKVNGIVNHVLYSGEFPS